MEYLNMNDFFNMPNAEMKRMIEDAEGKCSDSEDMFARLKNKYHFAETASAKGESLDLWECCE